MTRYNPQYGAGIGTGTGVSAYPQAPFEAAGLLDEGRGLEILDSEVESHERFTG